MGRLAGLLATVAFVALMWHAVDLWVADPGLSYGTWLRTGLLAMPWLAIWIVGILAGFVVGWCAGGPVE